MLHNVKILVLLYYLLFIIDLIKPYHILSQQTKLELGFAYFQYVEDMILEIELLWHGNNEEHKINVQVSNKFFYLVQNLNPQDH